MSQEGTRLKWENESGSMILTINGKEERAFSISRDFIEEFRKEFINTAGESTFKMIMRKLLEKLGKKTGDDVEANWDSFEKFSDEQILPVSSDGLNIPKEYKPWDGKTRNLALLPDVPMSLWTVSSFQSFKEVLFDVMTEKGTNALINSAGKKGGIAIGGKFAKFLGWNDWAKAVASVSEMADKLYPIMGWGKGGAVLQKGKDGKEMILLKIQHSYESHGKKSTIPICSFTSSQLNGLWSSLAETLGGQAAEAREVKCTAKGDSHCVFAIKIKDKGAQPLDWKEIAPEWEALA